MTIATRVKAVRARAVVRRWQYRQRNLAQGAWDRFRSALAHARDAFAIDEATAAALIAEGCDVDDRGATLEPPRTMVWITVQRAATLVRARPLALRLDADLLGAQWLALVPFERPSLHR